MYVFFNYFFFFKTYYNIIIIITVNEYRCFIGRNRRACNTLSQLTSSYIVYACTWISPWVQCSKNSVQYVHLSTDCYAVRVPSHTDIYHELVCFGDRLNRRDSFEYCKVRLHFFQIAFVAASFYHHNNRWSNIISDNN